MEFNHVIALVLLLLAVPITTLVAMASRLAREAAFFLLTAGAVLTERMDVHFFGQFWYRGTTRGIEISALDILAFSLLAACLLRPRDGRVRWYWPAGLSLMLLYFIYCCFSVVVAEPKLMGIWELSKILRGIVIFLAAAFFVRSRRELALLAAALGCAVCFESLLGLKQHLWDGMSRVPASFDHPNSFSMYLCLVSPIFVAAAGSDFPRWLRWFCTLCIGLTAVSILLTVSRAGLPSYALVMLGAAAWCLSWKITPKKIAMGAAFCLALGLVWIRSWGLVETRYQEASIQEEYFSEEGEGRGVYLRWAWAIMGDHFFGVGLNNWSYWVSKVYGPRSGFRYEDYDELTHEPDKNNMPDYNWAAPAHSLAALTLGELGVPGFLIFTLVWLRWFSMGAVFLRRRDPDPLWRMGTGIFFCLGGIFLQSTTEWTYRQTPIFFTCHLLVGTLTSLYCWQRAKATQAEKEEFAITTEDLEALEPAVVETGG